MCCVSVYRGKTKSITLILFLLVNFWYIEEYGANIKGDVAGLPQVEEELAFGKQPMMLFKEVMLLLVVVVVMVALL